MMDISAGSGFSPSMLGLIFSAFFIGGLTKGVSGFGMPLVVVSILVNFLPPTIVLGINVLPPVLLNLFQVGSVVQGREALMRFWPVLAGIFVATLAGALVTAALDKQMLILVIGVVSCGFSLLSLSGWSPKPNKGAETWVGAAAGLASGLSGVFSTVNGPPLVMYLLYVGTEARLFKATLGLCLACSNVLLVIAFSSVGFLTPATALVGVAAILPAGLGMWLGNRLSRRVNAALFQKIVLALLLVVGSSLIYRGLMR